MSHMEREIFERKGSGEAATTRFSMLGDQTQGLMHVKQGLTIESPSRTPEYLLVEGSNLWLQLTESCEPPGCQGKELMLSWTGCR